MTITQIAKYLTGMAAAIGVCVSIGGCALTKPAGAGFASVEIEGHTQKEIEDATIKVFEQAGYISLGVKDELEFESDGKEWMQLAYGSNLADGASVMERVRAQVVDQNDGTFRLQCSAYVVPPDVSDTKEIKLRLPRSGPYRELLEQVAQELSKTP